MNHSLANERSERIEDLARQFARIWPEDCDTDPHPLGGASAGYTGHEDGEEHDAIGWYSAGGNVGHRVLTIRTEEVPTLLAYCRQLDLTSSQPRPLTIGQLLADAGVDGETGY